MCVKSWTPRSCDPPFTAEGQPLGNPLQNGWHEVCDGLMRDACGGGLGDIGAQAPPLSVIPMLYARKPMNQMHPNFARSILAAAAALVGTAAAGCSFQPSASLADDATAAVSQAQKAAGVTRLATAPVREEDQGNPENAANRVEGDSIAGLYPAGCVSITRTSLTELHIEFDDCTGPFGLVHLRGGIDETFSLDPNGRLVADLADSGDFTAEGRPVDYQAHAELRSLAPEQAEIGWQAHWEAELAQGQQVSCDTTVTILAEPATGCLTIDGTSAASVDERGLDATIEGYEVCPIECPKDGTITATGKSSHETVVIDFDGSSTAKVQLQNGPTYEVPLVCAAL
jgi:hypothetical protein